MIQYSPNITKFAEIQFLFDSIQGAAIDIRQYYVLD